MLLESLQQNTRKGFIHLRGLHPLSHMPFSLPRWSSLPGGFILPSADQFLHSLFIDVGPGTGGLCGSKFPHVLLLIDATSTGCPPSPCKGLRPGPPGKTKGILVTFPFFFPKDQPYHLLLVVVLRQPFLPGLNAFCPKLIHVPNVRNSELIVSESGIDGTLLLELSG